MLFSRMIVGWRATSTRAVTWPWLLWSKLSMLAPKATGLHTTATAVSNLDPLHRASAQASIESSVGSVGDAYDNALAETVIGLYKTEVMRRRGPWRNLEHVEFVNLEWVDWLNN